MESFLYQRHQVRGGGFCIAYNVCIMHVHQNNLVVENCIPQFDGGANRRL